MSERSSCGASFGNVKISDLDFADDGVIFAETLDIRLGVLEELSEKSEPLGLRVSRVKTKIQAFNDILDAAILCALRLTAQMGNCVCEQFHLEFQEFHKKKDKMKLSARPRCVEKFLLLLQ